MLVKVILYSRAPAGKDYHRHAVHRPNELCQGDNIATRPLGCSLPAVQAEVERRCPLELRNQVGSTWTTATLCFQTQPALRLMEEYLIVLV